MPRDSPPTRRTALKAVTALVAGTLTGLNADEVIHERTRLEVTRLEVPVRDWPADLDGFTVGFLTDLHRSDMVPHDLIERAVDATLAGRPELIVLGGDYVTWGNRDYVESAAESLERLAAPHGVFAVLGNHDDDRDMPAALARKGIEVLKDERTRVPLRRVPVDLVGVRFWTRRAADIAGIMDHAHPARILIAHDPRRVKEGQQLGFPLVLSGHTHGGQVVLPGLGAVAARRFPVAEGHAVRGGTSLFVSRGIGTVYVPIRYRCAPEVALLTLRRPPGARAS
jgi:hypothetical protein